MQLTRRGALLAAGTLTVGLSGCVSRSTSAAARAFDRTTGPYERGPRQGRADPLVREKPVVVDDPDLEYLPEKDAVRFPALANLSGVVAYDTVPFDRWSQLKAAEAGVDAIWTTVSDRLGDDAHHIGRGAASSFPGMVVELSHDTELDEEGNVVSEPAVSFADLLAVTPASVTVSVSLDERTATHTVPVQVIETSSRPVTLVSEGDADRDEEEPTNQTTGRP